MLFLLECELLALLFVVIYVGAVAILFLFAIMMNEKLAILTLFCTLNLPANSHINLNIKKLTSLALFGKYNCPLPDRTLFVMGLTLLGINFIFWWRLYELIKHFPIVLSPQFSFSYFWGTV